MTVLLLAAAFLLIVAGAGLFTNAVEWLGNRLDMDEGGTGSILAAVGTALPESTIPVIAVLAGSEGQSVAIGSIIGAPFMLATIAMLLIAISAVIFHEHRGGPEVEADGGAVRRDLFFFFPSFAAGIVLGQIDSKPLHIAGAVVLIGVYIFYVRLTLKGGEGSGEEDELDSLYFDTSKQDPPSTFQIVLQGLVALACIIGGAELFVQEIKKVSEDIGVDPLVLSLIIAPLATELPEKINSVIWMKAGKDRLAVGNVTGALAFQSTIPVAFGLAITDWYLNKFATAAGVIALLGAALAYWRLEAGTMGHRAAIAWAALFLSLIVFVIVG